MGRGKSSIEVYKSIDGLTAEQVHEVTTEYPLLFIRYFEAVIDKDGLVYFGVPSHEEKVLELAEKQNKFTRQMCYEHDWCGLDVADHFGYVLTWYHNIMGTPNAKQKETIEKLKEYKLLEKFPDDKEMEKVNNILAVMG